MQFVRYEACTDEPGVRAELQRLQVQKFLTPRQAEAVDVQKILRLFSSPLGKTLLSAKTLRREFKFSILTDAEAYSPEAAGEQVMLQGVVDCFWQEPDGIVILDFKTDYIDGDLQQKAERYAPPAPRLRRRPLPHLPDPGQKKPSSTSSPPISPSRSDAPQGSPPRGAVSRRLTERL